MNEKLLKFRFDKFTEEVNECLAKNGRSSDSLTIIGVSKTKPTSTLQEAIDSGILNLGENKVQEIVEKVPLLKGSFTMHMIGHLQSNKVNKVVPLVSWIHSIDSVRLANKISSQCEKENKTISGLVQVNTSGELSKSGCKPDEASELAHYISELPYINFRGFMTIGPLHGNEKSVRNSFTLLRDLGEKNKNLAKSIELSMGMSGDYKMAIEEGSTMIRVGTVLFGGRNLKA